MMQHGATARIAIKTDQDPFLSQMLVQLFHNAGLKTTVGSKPRHHPSSTGKICHRAVSTTWPDTLRAMAWVPGGRVARRSVWLKLWRSKDTSNVAAG